MHSNRGKPKSSWSSPSFRDRASNSSVSGSPSSSALDASQSRANSNSTEDIAMFTQCSNNDEAIRPPIQPRIERLVDGGQFSQLRLSSVSHKRKANNGVSSGFEFDSDDSSAAKRPAVALAELFRPPIELLFVGTFDLAKRYAAMNRRWLLIDIQKSDEFMCMRLNRDVYRNDIVRDMIRENLVLCQYEESSTEGMQFCAFYQVSSYPFVALVDPRTGELAYRVRAFEPSAFLEVLSDFLASHPLCCDEYNKDNISSHNDTVINNYRSDPNDLLMNGISENRFTEHYGDLQQTKKADQISVDSDIMNHEFTGVDSMASATSHPASPFTSRSSAAGSTAFVNDLRSRSQNVSKTERTAVLSCIEAFSCLSVSSRTPISDDVASHSSYSSFDSAAERSPFSSSATEYNAASECCAHSAESRLSHLLVRLPDGSRTRIFVHAQRTIDEFLVHVSRCSLTSDRFRFVTDFPRIDLGTAMNRSLTFEQHHLVPSGTIYIEEL